MVEKDKNGIKFLEKNGVDLGAHLPPVWAGEGQSAMSRLDGTGVYTGTVSQLWYIYTMICITGTDYEGEVPRFTKPHFEDCTPFVDKKMSSIRWMCISHYAHYMGKSKQAVKLSLKRTLNPKRKTKAKSSSIPLSVVQYLSLTQSMDTEQSGLEYLETPESFMRHGISRENEYYYLVGPQLCLTPLEASEASGIPAVKILSGARLGRGVTRLTKEDVITLGVDDKIKARTREGK